MVSIDEAELRRAVHQFTRSESQREVARLCLPRGWEYGEAVDLLDRLYREEPGCAILGTRTWMVSGIVNVGAAGLPWSS